MAPSLSRAAVFHMGSFVIPKEFVIYSEDIVGWWILLLDGMHISVCTGNMRPGYSYWLVSLLCLCFYLLIVTFLALGRSLLGKSRHIVVYKVTTILIEGSVQSTNHIKSQHTTSKQPHSDLINQTWIKSHQMIPDQFTLKSHTKIH